MVNTPGDGVKIKGTNGVTIKRTRVEWESGPSTENGAYGLYPVQTRNVLIEDTESDMYVAIDRAAERASRTLGRRLTRQRDRNRIFSRSGLTTLDQEQTTEFLS